jgi:serine protease
MRLVHITRAAIMVLTIGALLGCGADDVGPQSHMVGGRCTVDNDCIKRCVTGTHFPGGYCTVSCTTDRDCPGGATCGAISGLAGGICLAVCQIPADCNGYGAGYQCNRQTNQGGGMAALACVGP